MDTKRKYSPKSEYVAVNMEKTPQTKTSCEKTKYCIIFMGIIIIISILILSLNNTIISNNNNNITQSIDIQSTTSLPKEEEINLQTQSTTSLPKEEEINLQTQSTTSLPKEEEINLQEPNLNDANPLLNEIYEEGKDFTISNKTIILNQNGTILIN